MDIAKTSPRTSEVDPSQGASDLKVQLPHDVDSLPSLGDASRPAPSTVGTLLESPALTCFSRGGNLTSTSWSPRVGRWLHYQPDGEAPPRKLVGGAVLVIGCGFLQLTSGHPADVSSDYDRHEDTANVPFVWDEDSEDEELEETDMEAGMFEIVSRGSDSDDAVRGEEDLSCSGDSSASTESLARYAAAIEGSFRPPLTRLGPAGQEPGTAVDTCSTEGPATTGIDVSAVDDSSTGQAESPLVDSPGSHRSNRSDSATSAKETQEAGPSNETAISLSSRVRALPRLDYALIDVENPPDPSAINRVSTPDASRELQIKDWARIGDQVRNVLVAVSSKGPAIRGVLSPAPAFFRDAGQTESHVLYSVVLLDGAVIRKGCSGAAVVDARSGDLCGHVVRGCLGESLAYIVPAEAVFEDLVGLFGDTVRVGFAGW